MRRRISVASARVVFSLLPAMAIFLSTGCMATRYSSSETLANVHPSETLVRSYYIEHVEGGIFVPNAHAMNRYGDSPKISPDRSDIDRLLHRHYPLVFNRKDGAVPLHVECSGTIPPAGLEANAEINPMVLALFWRYHEKGKITVSLLLDDAGAKRTVRVPFEKSRTESLLFWPLIVPGRKNWPTVFGNMENPHAVRTVLTELVASGVVKALNRATPEEMGKLVARAHRTEEQKSALEWLFSTTNTTFSVDAAGKFFVEVEHVYRPLPVNYTEKSALPAICGQSFNAETQTGKIVADVTGCDPSLAADYLLMRLIPAICRSKGVVFDPSATPPGGAVFKIMAFGQETENGKDIFRIEFVSVQ